MIPPDPPLDEAHALRAALRELGAELARGLPGRVPGVRGLAPTLLVRWLHRHRLESSGTWGPLVHVDPGLCGADPAVLLDAAALAARGWLWVEDGPLPLPDAELHAEAARRGGALLRPGRGAPIEVPDAIVRRISQLDAGHLVATDPALADLRPSLLSHCRSCSIIHLAGPSGTGRKSLAFWAAAVLDGRPPSHVRRGGPRRPAPGQWALYEEVSDLEPDQLHHLRERLGAADAAPTFLAEPDDDAPRRPDHPAFRAIRGESPALSRVLARAARVAAHPLSVLLLGESGVGKEALARAIHEVSGRPGPYRIADVSTLNEELVESELFGHVAGAFTGARGERVGALRAADRGTLFLDELGNLTPRVQAKLLRFLQEKTVQPVGSDRVHAVDVRVIAATHADLQAMVSRGEFREDLLRRLDAVSLRVPPLRERPEDILPLARWFLAQARAAGPLPGRWVSEDAASLLRAHAWPGNVRELQNVMSQAAAESDGAALEPVHLGPLAPRNRRPVPLITTSTEEGMRGSWPGMERHLAQRMTAVTLRLPPLRDRGPLSVRNAVLGLLEGRPVRSDALSVLERRPWWGNFTELHAALAAVRANVPGPVDLDALRRALPHLVRSGGSWPIRVLLDPVQEPSGAVSGLGDEFRTGAVLVGRVDDLPALQREAGAGVDAERLQPRLDALRDLLAGSDVACLNLRHLPRLGRAQFLVTRDEHGLVVHALPAVALPVFAAPLGPGGSGLREVRPGAPAALGPAGEVQVHAGREGGTYLQLFLFAGAVALEEHGAAAAERARRGLPTGAPTVFLGAEEGSTEAVTSSVAAVATAPAPGNTERKVGIWALDRDEARALNDVVLRFRGGDFKAHLERELSPRATEPQLARLVAYLLGPRPTQYCARLYGHRLNAALRHALCDALLADGDPVGRLRQLPQSVAQEVEERLLERVGA